MILFLLTSLLLRLNGLATTAIWYDEAISRYRAQNMFISNQNAPMWDLLLVPFANGPVWLMRLPGLFFAMLALWLAWKLMDELAFTKPQRIAACILMAALPGLIWLAQDARCYSAMTCAYMAALYFGYKNRPLGLAAAVGLLGFIHPTGMGLGAAALLLAMSRMTVRRVSLASLGCLAWIPVLVLYIVRKAEDSNGFWLLKIEPLRAISQAAFVNTVPVAVGGTLIILLLFFMIKRRDLRILWLMTTTPIIIQIAFSMLVTPVLFYRPLMPVLIPLCMLAGAGLVPSRPGVLRWIPAALAAGLLLVSVTHWDPSGRGGHVDNIAALINANWQEGDQLVYATGTVALPIDFYLQRPSCILDWKDYNLSPRNLVWTHCPPGTPQAGRTWLVWPNDILLKAQRPEGLLVASTWGEWVFSRMDVILIEK